MSLSTFLLVLMLALVLPGDSLAQPAAASSDGPLDAAARAAVIDELLKKIDDLYIFPDEAKKMESAIRARQGEKAYDGITNGPEFARVLTDDLHAVCKDMHLGVDYSAEVIPLDPAQPSAEVIERFWETGRRRNYEFKKVERLDGGIGLLQLDCFYPVDRIKDIAAGAMAFLANSEAVILDLRQNHGFADGGILIASYFFDEETHLSDVYNRSENLVRQVWTYPVVLGPKLADKDLYILTSRQTFSAPEAFAYDMQALKRATIVGERTGGGAHATMIHRITDHFSATIPFSRGVNPVTHTDYEGIGVKPDVEVPADQALLTAHLMALNKAVKRHSDDKDLVESLKHTIAEKEAELAALKAKATIE